MKHLLTMLFAILIASQSIAQTAIDILEKDHGISRKSRKGYLGQVTASNAAGTFDLIFVLKPTAKKIPFEIYTFDKDLNLIKTTKDEEEREKLNRKWKWFKFKGEDYESKSVYVRANMKGQLVLREKSIKWKWSWFRGGYSIKTKTGPQIKPKNEAGEKYDYWGGFYDNDDEGNILVPAYDKGTDHGSAHILKVDGEGEVTDVSKFTMPKNRNPVFSAALEGELNTDGKSEKPDWILLFAASKGSEGSEQDYTYLRVDGEGVIKEQKEFQVKNAPWYISGAIQKNGEVFFYGPSIDKAKYSSKVLGNIVPTTSDEDAEDKQIGKNQGGGIFGAIKNIKNVVSGEAFLQTQEDIDKRLDEMKYSNFQIAKISDNKLVYLNNPTIKDINKGVVKPDGQKKESEFDGKKFITTNAQISSDKNFLISGQDFSTDKKLGREYKDVFLLQFDAEGNYKHFYGVKLDQKKFSKFFHKGLFPQQFNASSMMIESTDKKKMYWMIGECKNIDTDTDVDVDYNYVTGVQTTSIRTSQNGLYTIQYGALDLVNGTASEFKVLGDDEKRNYYLFPNHNALRLNQYQIFISETTKGDRILLSRFDLSK